MKEFHMVVKHIVEEEERAAVSVLSGVRLTDVKEADINAQLTNKVIAAGLAKAKTDSIDDINAEYATYVPAEYPTNYSQITAIKDTAIAEINAETSILDIFDIRDKASLDMVVVVQA